jgi:hypothetical protein
MVEIPLRIHGTRNQTLDFRIRARPRAGRLSEVKQTAQESASVSYTPPADLRVKQDQFSYAVRSKEGVSAAADVLITIVDAAPLLITPDTLTFPSLVAGAMVAQEIVVANHGGGLAEGELEIEAPWAVEGPRAYRLGAEERQSFKVLFAPTTGGDFRGELHYSSHRGRVTALRGQARPAIAVVPGTLQLQHDAASSVRAGAFAVTNHTAQEQSLTFSASDRLAFPRVLILPAGGTHNVLVQMAANDLSAFSGEILAAGGGNSAAVGVLASPVGPLLRVREPVVRFHEALPNAPTRAEVQIENRGGTAANVILKITPPFTVEAGNLIVEPGAAKRVAIALSSSREGTERGTLHIRSQTGQLEVPLEAKVVAKRELPGRDNLARRVSADPARVIKTALPSQESSGLVPERLLVQKTTSTSATIEWPADFSSATRFKAEERRLSLHERTLKIDWVEHPGFRTEKNGGRVIGTFTGLTPGQVYMMRVVPVLGPEAQATPLVDVQFRTRPEPPHKFRITPLRILIVLFVVGIATIIWRRIKQRTG